MSFFIIIKYNCTLQSKITPSKKYPFVRLIQCAILFYLISFNIFLHFLKITTYKSITNEFPSENASFYKISSLTFRLPHNVLLTPKLLCSLLPRIVSCFENFVRKISSSASKLMI